MRLVGHVDFIVTCCHAQQQHQIYLLVEELRRAVGFEQLGHVAFDSWTDMLRVLPQLLKLEGYRTVYSLASKHVRDARLRVVLTFQSLLVGGNPFATTSVYCLIAFLERRWRKCTVSRWCAPVLLTTKMS